MQISTRPLFWLVAVTLILTVGGCSLLQNLGKNALSTPEIRYNSMKFDQFGFDGVTMMFSFDVDNPNRVDLTARGYNYAFSVDGNRFLEGNSGDGIALRSQASTRVEVPVTVNFAQLGRTVGSVLSQDSIAYNIASTFTVDIPVLGLREIPVQASGFLPVPKMPEISLENISLGTLSLTGAEVRVRMKFSNPNPFGLSFSDINYRLAVDGENWVSTRLQQLINLGAKSETVIDIPVRLDFAQVGTSVYRLFTGRNAFDYTVSGDGRLNVDLPFFEPNVNLPFSVSGRYNW
jgi:LEA14-like dessication related protein